MIKYLKTHLQQVRLTVYAPCSETHHKLRGLDRSSSVIYTVFLIDLTKSDS